MLFSFHGTEGTDRLLGPPLWWRRRRTYIVAGLLVAAAALSVLLATLLHLSGTAKSVERSQLTIATVTRGTFTREVAADGQVVAAVSPTLYATATGTVTLKVHAGDAVNKGETLAVLESPALTASLTQEQATLESDRLDWQRAQLEARSRLAQLQQLYEQAKVDEATARRTLDRSREAYKLGSYTELQMLKAQDDLQKAQFALAGAKLNYGQQPRQNRLDVGSKRAALDRQQALVNDLQRQVAALRTISPVDGRVGSVQVEDRATIAKDVALLTVVDLSALEVQIQVPESVVRDLAPGMSADIESDGRRWEGSVSAVSPQVVDGQVVARVRFTGEDARARPQGLRQNQRMSVRVLIDRKENTLMINRGTSTDQDGAFAYVVHGNIAQRQPIRLGAESIQKVQVLEGLAEGEQVVVSGADVFKDAERVVITD
jgi:HlyD family secretion protein